MIETIEHAKETNRNITLILLGSMVAIGGLVWLFWTLEDKLGKNHWVIKIFSLPVMILSFLLKPLFFAFMFFFLAFTPSSTPTNTNEKEEDEKTSEK